MYGREEEGKGILRERILEEEGRRDKGETEEEEKQDCKNGEKGTKKRMEGRG